MLVLIRVLVKLYRAELLKFDYDHLLKKHLCRNKKNRSFFVNKNFAGFLTGKDVFLT